MEAEAALIENAVDAVLTGEKRIRHQSKHCG
jgi:hypothetical protein